MNIIQIGQNAMIGSTGKITCDLDNVINSFGYSGYMAVAYTEKILPNMYCSSGSNSVMKMKENIFITRLTGRTGYRNKKQTIRMLEWVKEKKPDLLHLHIIHGDWVNLRLLFDFIKELNVPVIWTLHDCWSFTGRCSHFEMCSCEKWKTGCYACKNKKVYPKTYFFDSSKQMWRDKKKWFTGVNNLVIVTPSNWLAKYVKESYLGQYPIHVIRNGINLDIYKPTSQKSALIRKAGNKRIILGITSTWTKMKGFNDIIQLDSIIDHSIFQIVMVGLNDSQIKKIPKSIIGIKRTNNQKELVDLYSSSDVFINPTYLDNYPTTNLEASACGTPVITYRTGGSVESVKQGINGMVVNQGSIKEMYEAIIDVCINNKIDRRACFEYAQDNFSKEKCYKEYIELYNETLGVKNAN